MPVKDLLLERFLIVRARAKHPFVRRPGRVDVIRRELDERRQLEDADRFRLRFLERLEIGLGLRGVAAQQTLLRRSPIPLSSSPASSSDP